MAEIDEIAKALATSGIKEAEKEALVSFSDGIQRKLNTKEEAEEVARTIENAPRMTALEFRGNTIGVEAGERIAKALEKHPELQRALWSDMFTGRLKTEIPPILRSLCNSMMAVNVHLTELDLSDNAFGPIGAEGIEHFLRSPSAFSLQALKLNNNGLGGGGKVIAQALLDCHQNSTAAGNPLKLKVFVAGRNRLENPGAIALAAAFAKIGTLEEVTIPQNGIYHKGVTALARAFRKNKNLRVLNLSDNTFTVKGATAMSQVLPMLTNLEVINFSDCLCRDAGTKLIITAIGDGHKALKEVNLSGNEIGPDVAKLALQHFSGNKALNMTLQANNFGSRFSEVQNVANEATFTVDVGIESDDEGSLSSGDEEEGPKSASEESVSDSGSASGDEASGPSFSESANEDALMKNGHTRAELDNAQSFHVFMTNPTLTALHALGPNPSLILVAHLQDEISDRNPDAVAKVLINLGSIVTSSNESESLPMVVECADAILHEAESIAMAPLSPIAQIVNNLFARIGVVKTDSAVERPSNLFGLARLLGQLVDRGHFATHLTTLGYFFGQRVKKDYPQNAADIDALIKRIDSAISEWDREQ